MLEVNVGCVCVCSVIVEAHKEKSGRNVNGNYPRRIRLISFTLSYLSFTWIIYMEWGFLLPLGNTISSWKKKKRKNIQATQNKMWCPPKKNSEKCACLWPSGFTCGIGPKEIIWMQTKLNGIKILIVATLILIKLPTSSMATKGIIYDTVMRWDLVYHFGGFWGICATWKMYLCHNNKWKARCICPKNGEPFRKCNINPMK